MAFYKATFLVPDGVHYDGDIRFEPKKPVLVDEGVALRLLNEVVDLVSYGPNGEAFSTPQPKFKVEEVVPLDEPEAPAPVTVPEDADKTPATPPTTPVRRPAVPPQ